MDRLDRISIWVIVVLIISSFVLTSGYKGEAGPDRKAPKRMAGADFSAANGEVDKKMRVIKNLMESNNLDKAEMLANELMQKYPYEGEPHMAMGDIFVRRQELMKAMPEYKEAVDLNPDYLDKKTPLFEGKKLKVVVNEALEEVEKRIDSDSADKLAKEERKLIYYIKRRIAGSCG
jgi:tetratricopeptide (TPR) repeat protein